MTRIIAGRAKGRRLLVPRGEATRPTTDRVREALFSTLASWFGTAEAEASRHLEGIAMLDLYAGSGAVGLEAASRGASPVVLAEHDRHTAALIRTNAHAAGLRVHVRTATAQAVAAQPGHRFGFIFLDPPYGLAGEAVDCLLATLAGEALTEYGLVVVERSSRDPDPVWPETFTDTWQRRYGETTLHFGALC